MTFMALVDTEMFVVCKPKYGQRCNNPEAPELDDLIASIRILINALDPILFVFIILHQFMSTNLMNF